MRSRVITFLLGFVAGVVVLYGFLWTGGVLNPYLAEARAASGRVEPAQHSPTVARGSAVYDSSPQSGFLALPIDGLAASDVLDTFNSTRPGGRSHEATDILARRGTPVHAMVDGTIRKLFFSKAGGNTIYEFDQEGVYCYYY